MHRSSQELEAHATLCVLSRLDIYDFITNSYHIEARMTWSIFCRHWKFHCSMLLRVQFDNILTICHRKFRWWLGTEYVRTHYLHPCWPSSTATYGVITTEFRVIALAPRAGARCILDMMTSSNGNIFRVTGQLGGEFNGPRWIPHTKASDAELWCFLWSASE